MTRKTEKMGLCPRRSHKYFYTLLLIVFAVTVFGAALLTPSTAHSGPCDIAGPGNRSGTVGTPISSFSFSSSPNHTLSKMIITFTWTPGGATPPDGLTSISTPAPNTSRTISYTFSGTPTTAGVYNYNATAIDNAGKCTNVTTSGTITIANPAAMSISTNAIPDGQVGTAYNATVVATGGITPYTWTMSGQPTGLSIAAATGVITGTPAAGTDGTYNITVRATSSGGTPFIEKIYTVVIAPSPPALSVTTLSLPDGTVNIPYSYTVSATGGTPGYTWSLSSGSLPPGLALSAGGVISGTPTTASTYNPTLRVTDSVGAQATKLFSLQIMTAAAVATSSMSNYCVAPPFIPQEVTPNLLLMVDNSASTYDLTYIDKGSSTRSAYYCYDNTFTSTGSYPGYFDEAKKYKYNDSTFRFEVVASFAATCDKQLPSSGSAESLCIKGTNLNTTSTPKTVTEFYASGKYLNWLTASKFDVQKRILTGGKYDTGNGALISESRGCVGRRYVKEALTADYVEGGTNTSLGITFAAKGPIDPSNPSAPSPGGQTSIEIFVGDYNQTACQTAINLYSDPSCGHSCRRSATEACLARLSGTETTLEGETKTTFIQSVQECWQYDQTGTVGLNDAANSVKNKCPGIMDAYVPGKCSVTTSKVCSTNADCAAETPAGQVCQIGPSAILPGNPGLLCSTQYTGACYVGTAPYDKNNYTGTVISASGATADCSGPNFTGNCCIQLMHNKYCGDVKQPTVVDPTDEPSATDFYANVPAILGDVGVQSQLGNPIKTMLSRVATTTPSGIIQDYKSRIRFGAMAFNFTGSNTECSATDIVQCPRICSNDKSKTCVTKFDCPPTGTPTCDPVTSSNQYIDPVTGQPLSNQDAARIISHIGDPTYAANPVGDHTSGLIRSIGDLRGRTWTPFSEAMYTAVAYYTQNTTSGTRPYRLNAGDFTTTTNPVQSSCQGNYVLMITDGMATTDQNSAVRSLVASFNDGDGQITTAASASGVVAPKYFGSTNVDDIAWYAQKRNIFDPTVAPVKPKEKIGTYVVYTGEPCAAKDGAGNCTTTDETIPERLMQQTASNGGGSYHLATNQAQFKTALETIFASIAKSATSGTAASVLASGEGSGANLIQAVFYPLRQFEGGTEARWIGRMTNLWYYTDPFITSSGIYDDAGSPSDKVLDLTADNRVTLYYDSATKQTKALRVADGDDNGVPETILTPDINFEAVPNLWDASIKLWQRNLSTDPRTIKTSVGGSLIDFSTSNASTLKPYLQAADNTEAANLINYVHGTDIGGYRSRTVGIDLNGDGDVLDAGEMNTWKLGDIVHSTPKPVSRFALNNYYDSYADTTYLTFLTDATYGYDNRGIVFAGANDGMLHATYLGKLEQSGAWKDSQYKKAKLDDPLSIGLGKELWSFIPKNVLPYLKYMADPDYCHIYSVDLTPVIADVPIGDTAAGDISNTVKSASAWRTILIGGMRLGGACRRSDSACTTCIKAPGVDLDGSGSVNTDAEKTIGLSTYFALDITDTLKNPGNPAAYPPVLLWEFSSETLGASSSGPAIIKINRKTADTNGDSKYDGSDTSDASKNGKHFVVVTSGSTGPVDTGNRQFLGRSDQNLRIFILDLKTGTLVRTIDTGITEAFSGSIINSTIDVDHDYQHDVMYIPYVQKCSSTTSGDDACTSGTWTSGGVLRLLTKEDLDPANWAVGTLISGIGPVTGSVDKLLNTRDNKLWLYFGTGRYFFELDSADDPTNRRRLYGFKDPCFPFDITTTCSATLGGLTDKTCSGLTGAALTTCLNAAATAGWYINTATAGSGYRAGRSISSPVASTSGFVIFSTNQPKDNNCEPGGRTFLWAVNYATGGPTAAVKGKILIQMATGEIQQVDLATAFTEEGERRTTDLGFSTGSETTTASAPAPAKRVIHVRER